MSRKKDKWDRFPKHFTNISDKEALSTETFNEVIECYREFNVDEIHVKHMYFGTKAKIQGFILDSLGNLKTIAVWRLGQAGGNAYWDPSLVKIVNRPKRKRKRKVKADLKVKKVVTKKKKTTAKNKEKVVNPLIEANKQARKDLKVLLNNVSKCKEHSKYTGARSPRTDCKNCWKYYYFKHPEKKKGGQQ